MTSRSDVQPVAWYRIPLRDWNEFWFGAKELLPLGLFRIVTGLICLMKLLLLVPVLGDFYSEWGMLTLDQSQHVSYPPRLCVFDYLPPDAAPLVFAALLLAAVLFTFGLLTRPMTIVLFIGMMSIDNRNPWVTNSGDRLLSLMLFYGIFAPMGAAASIDRLLAIFRGKTPATAPRGPVWAVRLMQLQVCMMYFWAAFIKIRGTSWLGGEATYWMVKNIERSRWAIPFVGHSIGSINGMIAVNALAYFTMLVEGLFAFTVWPRRTRGYAIIGGLLLHLGIEQSMTIQIFGFVAMGTYLLFFDGNEYVDARDRIVARLLGRGPTRVFYDGDCGFCTRTIEVVEAADAFRRLEFVSFRDPEIQRLYPDLDLARCEQEIMLKDRRGRWYGGFSACRWIAWRVPVFWLLAPFLYLPGIPWLGNRVYRWVAGHRSLIKVGGGGACSLPPRPAEAAAQDADDGASEARR